MLKSKTTNLGGGYRILTELVDRGEYGQWLEYRLCHGDKNLAWCCKPRAKGAYPRDIWGRASGDYQQYLQSGFAQFPFF